MPPSGVRPFPRCRHARPPHGPCPAPRSPSRAAATPPTSGFSALSVWHAVVLGPSAGGGGVPRGQVRLAPTCMLLSGDFGSKAALGTLSTQALTGSRDTPRPACDSNGPWAEWATGPRRPTCAYSDLANRVGSPRVTCSWPACSRPAGDPAQLPPAPSSPSRPSRNLGAPRGVSMCGMEVLVGRRGREAWTHGVTFPGLRSPLQWAGEEQARRRVPGPGSHTARTPAHPQATGRSTGVIGRRDRQELEQGGREQQALCPVPRRGRGRGMGGGASLGTQLELTSQRQPLLPLQGGVLAGGPWSWWTKV